MFVPVEFAGAAFRFGHSMIRPSYRMNFRGDDGKPYFRFTFDPRDNGKAVPDDLRGGSRQNRRFVDWESFFDSGTDVSDVPRRSTAHLDDVVSASARCDTDTTSP